MPKAQCPENDVRSFNGKILSEGQSSVIYNSAQRSRRLPVICFLEDGFFFFGTDFVEVVQAGVFQLLIGVDLEICCRQELQSMLAKHQSVELSTCFHHRESVRLRLPESCRKSPPCAVHWDRNHVSRHDFGDRMEVQRSCAWRRVPPNEGDAAQFKQSVVQGVRQLVSYELAHKDSSHNRQQETDIVGDLHHNHGQRDGQPRNSAEESSGTDQSEGSWV
mmetsp:Transcript_47687/g.93718  ORF Transcript_47687/g.93718 Transcript_47687/m.93718 type:complete len:219 (+) Transcript_47687:171-827(+)